MVGLKIPKYLLGPIWNAIIMKNVKKRNPRNDRRADDDGGAEDRGAARPGPFGFFANFSKM